jgi:hypothetical protein
MRRGSKDTDMWPQAKLRSSTTDRIDARCIRAELYARARTFHDDRIPRNRYVRACIRNTYPRNNNDDAHNDLPLITIRCTCARGWCITQVENPVRHCSEFLDRVAFRDGRRKKQIKRNPSEMSRDARRSGFHRTVLLGVQRRAGCTEICWNPAREINIHLF